MSILSLDSALLQSGAFSLVCQEWRVVREHGLAGLWWPADDSEAEVLYRPW